tara:strand:- start:1108 stop:1275 length:168 start_codon:yes stop_codon:yes gene_type:complete
MTGLTKITLTKQDIATGEDLNIKDILMLILEQQRIQTLILNEAFNLDWNETDIEE